MKPTDSNTTLYFTSAHPKHCRQGMVYGQYLRLGRICFRLQDYITKALIKIKKFLKRGYPRDLLLKELIHAASMTGQSFCRPINHNLTLTNNHSSRFLSPHSIHLSRDYGILFKTIGIRWEAPTRPGTYMTAG